MAARGFKNRQPGSLRQALELCLEYARVRNNRSVDRVADRMGLSSKWSLYRWLQNGRLPANLIRPFEEACGIDYVTRYIGHSAHKLLIDIPSGRKVRNQDINTLQASFTDSLSLLIKFYDGTAPADETLASLYTTMTCLAWHQGTVERQIQPELDLMEEASEC